jgi:uncharacterized protein YbjT (DUF2867 family)
MRVLLTGGSGFVGQHLIRQLCSEGHTVVALARSTSSAQKVADAGAEPVRGDMATIARGIHADAEQQVDSRKPPLRPPRLPIARKNS